MSAQLLCYKGFPGGSPVRNPSAKVGEKGDKLQSWVGKNLEGNGNPLQGNDILPGNLACEEVPGGL